MWKFTIKYDDNVVASQQSENKAFLVCEAIYNLNLYTDEDFKKITLELKQTNKSESIEYSDSFLVFWDLYPHTHRGNKQKLWKAYKRVLVQKRATEEEIIEGVKKYKQSQRVADGYIKGGEAWLNNDMFFANLPLVKQTKTNFMDRFKED